jgi:glycosyltransferase involved in cell wall biosynthesis
MRIAVFDYFVKPTNPIGGCHWKIVKGLCHRHEFTVFSVQFENPCPERIRWVRIPLPARPYVLVYALFHLIAPLVYAYHYLVLGARFDLVQMVESNLLFGDISYSQFCHRMYMKQHWHDTKVSGLRGFLRGLAHRAAALMEPLVYRRVRNVVVPSRGLSTELAAEYPGEKSKIWLLPNPVDVTALSPPGAGDREALRARMRLDRNDLAMVFVALGHFERKGLPLLLEAIAQSGDRSLKLLVIGGERDLVDEYRDRVRGMGLEGQVFFEGLQRDLRPYYWAADAFVFPSCYETFSLVTFEAAAAGLPVLVTRLNGVEEMLSHRDNGFLIERSVSGVAEGIQLLRALSAEQRRAMGERARATVLSYSNENFVAAWGTFYERMA